MYQILLHKKADKFLLSSNLSQRDRDRIVFTLEVLAKNGLSALLDIKKLIGFTNIYRIRVGDFRILLTVEHKQLQIFIITIATRKNAYKH